jgi:tRNA threonylcarbamoyladenosine biosynthesis protein TsaE
MSQGRVWSSASPAETRAIGALLAAELLPDGVLLLEGDLGAGKTVLAQGIAGALGIDPADVQSPTYTLIREHRGPRGTFLHVDLYRLEPAAVGDLGLDEQLAGPGVKVVEWGERLPYAWAESLHLRMVRLPDSTRRLIEMTELIEP